MYETTDLKELSFTDKRIIRGTRYEYAIQVKRDDGKTSPLSENITIATEGE